MNINPESLYRTGQSASTPAPAGAGRRAGSPAADAPALRDDALSFSAGAETFLSARARLDEVPQASRDERIAKLAELVARGEYSVDGETIANAMIADEPTARMLGLGPAQ